MDIVSARAKAWMVMRDELMVKEVLNVAQGKNLCAPLTRNPWVFTRNICKEKVTNN